MTKEKINPTKNPPKEITFHHIKSDNFRSVLATGIIGGVTVNSLVNMNFYTDRTVIPNELTFEIEESGKLGKEINRVSKQGVIRDIQFGVLMDVVVAKNLVKWLNEKIEHIESTAPKTQNK